MNIMDDKLLYQVETIKGKIYSYECFGYKINDNIVKFYNLEENHEVHVIAHHNFDHIIRIRIYE